MEIVLVSAFLFSLASCENTFYFLHGYEPLNYDNSLVNEYHERLKRSVHSDSNVRPKAKSEDHLLIEFKSERHSKKFKLRLKRDNSAFSDNHQLDINGQLVENSDVGFLYDGVDLNDKGSYVYGSVIDGIFDGHIYGSKDHFYIEKMSKYNQSTGNDFGHHSILYKDDDINYPKLRVKRAAPSMGTCGLRDSVTEWMNKVQNNAESATENFRSIEMDQSGEEVHKPWLKYVRRNKRASSPQKDARSGLFTGRTCTMYLQADHKLWEYVFNHEGQKNADRTRNEIFALFNNHIKAVNAIYESTDFGGVRGINFNVQRTTIWDSSSCPNSDLEDPKKNSFCEDNVDVSNFLNLHSIKNHSDFCLAYVLTSRDFVGGTLGLAWVASTTSAKRESFGYSYEITSSGGLCEPYKWYSEGSRRVRRSLNTGIITVVNYHNRVPMKVSQLTLAHEIGHNFGSPHDFPAGCQPGLPEGNYIMFASATSGDKPNNAKFSPCSVANISAVLKEVLAQPPNLDMSGVRRNCLIDPMTSFCGNGVVEDGEQCDCGYDEAECEQRQDHCCYARTTRGKLNENRCQRLPNANCSITQGPCCNQQCGFVPLGQLVCRQASDCSKASVCDGQKAACPSPSPRPDNTLCQENTKICNAGNCNRSICELVGMEECFITMGTPEDQCQLSCRNKNDINANCLPSTNIAALRPYFLNKTDAKRGILLRPGSPCNDYRGYCDIFQKCRSVDSNGPLSRLKNLLFNKETLKTVGDWVQENWWIVLIIAIVVIFLMAVFIKCCAVHTPSTNPRKPPAQSIYETLRHPTTLLRQGHHRHRRDPSQPPLQPQPQSRQQGHRHHHHHRRQRRSQSGGPNGVSGAPPAADHHRRTGGAPPDDGRRRDQRHRSGAARYSNAPNNELPNGIVPTTVVTVNVAPVAGSSRLSQPLQSASIIVEPPPPYSERGDKPLIVAVPPVGAAAASGLAAYSGAVSGSNMNADQATAAARPPARGHRKRKRPRNDDPKSSTTANNEPRRVK